MVGNDVSSSRLPGKVVGNMRRSRNGNGHQGNMVTVRQEVNPTHGKSNGSAVVDTKRDIHHSLPAPARRPPLAPPPPPPIPKDNEEKGLLYQITISVIHAGDTQSSDDEINDWTLFQQSIQWESVMGGMSGVDLRGNEGFLNNRRSDEPQAQQTTHGITRISSTPSSSMNRISGFGARVRRKFNIAEPNKSKISYISSISEGDVLHSINGHWVKTLSFENIQNKLREAFCGSGITEILSASSSNSNGRPPPQSGPDSAFMNTVSLTFLRKDQGNLKVSPSSSHSSIQPSPIHPNGTKSENAEANVVAYHGTNALTPAPRPTPFLLSTPLTAHRSFDTLLTSNTDLSQSFSNEAYLPSIFKNTNDGDDLNSSLAKNILMSSPMLSDNNEIIALHAGMPPSEKVTGKSPYRNMARAHTIERRQLEHDYEQKALPISSVHDVDEKNSAHLFVSEKRKQPMRETTIENSSCNDTRTFNSDSASSLLPSPVIHRQRTLGSKYSSRLSPANTPFMPPIQEIETMASSRSSPSSKSCTRHEKQAKHTVLSSTLLEDPEKPLDLTMFDITFIRNCPDKRTLERIIDSLTNPIVKYPTLLKLAQDRISGLSAGPQNQKASLTRVRETPTSSYPELAEPPTPYSFVTAQESISFASASETEHVFETPLHDNNCASISISDEQSSLISDTTSSVKSSYTNERESIESGESGLVCKSPNKGLHETASTEDLVEFAKFTETHQSGQLNGSSGFSSSSSSISVAPEKRQDVINLNVQIAHLKSRLKQLEALLESQKESYTTKVESLSRTKSAAEEEMKLMQELILDQSVQQETLELQLQKKSNEIHELEQQLKVQRERMENDSRAAAKQHMDLSQQIDELKEQLNRQESMHAALSKKTRADFDSILVQNDSAHCNHVKRLESDLRRAHHEISKLSEKSNSLAQKLDAALKSSSQIQKQAEIWTTKANKEAERSARYKSKYQQAKERYQLAEGVVDAMTEAMTEQEHTMDNLIKSHKEMEDLCDGFKMKQRQDSDELLKCRRRIEQLEKEVLESKERLDHMKTKEVGLKEEAVTASEEVRYAQKRIDKLEKDLKLADSSKRSEWLVKEENYKLQLTSSQRKWEKDLEAKNSEIKELQYRVKELESLISKYQQNKSNSVLRSNGNSDRNIKHGHGPLRKLPASASKRLNRAKTVHPTNHNATVSKSLNDIMSENDNLVNPPSIQSKSEAWKAQYEARKNTVKVPGSLDTDFVHATTDSSSAKENLTPDGAPREVTPTSVTSTPLKFQTAEPDAIESGIGFLKDPTVLLSSKATTGKEGRFSELNVKPESSNNNNLTHDARPSLKKGRRADLKAKLMRVRGSNARQTLQ